MNQDKQNTNKKVGIISAIVFGVLLLTAIVFYIVLGSFAVMTRIMFLSTLAALIVSAILNREIIKGMFRRTTLTGVVKKVQLLIVMGLLIFLYVLADMLSWKMDFSSARLYSFSQQTKEILSSVSNDLNILLFKPRMSSTHPLVVYQETLLQKYADRSSKVTLEIIDPDINPSKALEYGVDEPGTVVVEYQGNRLQVLFDEVYDLDSDTGNYSYTGEIAYTSAINSLLGSKAKNAYFLIGHGEINWADQKTYGYSDFIGSVEDDRIEVATLDLLKLPVVPEDCGVLVIGNPTKTFQQSEMDAVNNYLDNGGSVLVLLEYDTHIVVNDFLQNMGLFFLQNMVIDNQDYSPSLGTTWLIPTILPYPEITSPLLYSQFNLLLPTAVGISKLDNDLHPAEYSDHDFYVQRLLQSSTYSYAEMTEEEIYSGNSQEDDADLSGPIGLAYAVKRVKNLVFQNEEDGTTETNVIEARMVAIGDTGFINNLNISKGANEDFILNAFNFLLKRDADITTRPKAAGTEVYQLKSSAKRFLTVFAFGVIVIYLGVGIFIVVRRRRTVISKKDTPEKTEN